jgi:hypothetical protein
MRQTSSAAESACMAKVNSNYGGNVRSGERGQLRVLPGQL